MQISILDVVINMENISIGTYCGHLLKQVFFYIGRHLIGYVGMEQANSMIPGYFFGQIREQFNPVAFDECDGIFFSHFLLPC